jgi:hypothetical protein
MKRVFIAILFVPILVFAQKSTTEKVKIYLDCSWSCDYDFLQREMSYVDFYRDAKTANLHIIVKGERSSTGGEIVTFRFIGIEEFKGVENTLLLDVPPNTSDNDERLLYLEMLKKGIYAYIIRTSDKDNVSISFGETDKEDVKKEEKGKWNNWTFETSIGGYFSGQESYSNSNSYVSLSANRITEESKFTSSFYINSSISKYKFETDPDVTVENKSKYANMTYVKSKGEHFSIGAKANYSQATFMNYDGSYKFSPCVEYNLFPYSESSEHRLSLLYGVSVNHNDYTDTTVYLITSENFASHLFEFTYNNEQTWGSFNFSIRGNQILDKDDLRKYNIRISSRADWKITKGLSLNYSASFNFDRAQIHIPLSGVTYEEIILRQKELESNYFYYMYFGISYTFGSMKNNVVNPRF